MKVHVVRREQTAFGKIEAGELFVTSWAKALFMKTNSRIETDDGGRMVVVGISPDGQPAGEELSCGMLLGMLDTDPVFRVKQKHSQ